MRTQVPAVHALSTCVCSGTKADDCCADRGSGCSRQWILRKEHRKNSKCFSSVRNKIKSSENLVLLFPGLASFFPSLAQRTLISKLFSYTPEGKKGLKSRKAERVRKRRGNCPTGTKENQHKDVLSTHHKRPLIFSHLESLVMEDASSLVMH